MSDELTQLQTELLLAFNDTPNYRTMEYLLAEYDDKSIYDACIELKNKGYFFDNVEFTYTLKGIFRAEVVSKYGSLPARMCYVLSEKGMAAIREFI